MIFMKLFQSFKLWKSLFNHYKMRNNSIILLSGIIGATLLFSCENSKGKLDAETIIAKSIEASGGGNYENTEIELHFRNIKYRSERNGENFSLERFTKDSLGNNIHDILDNAGFERFINDAPIKLPDSMATKFSNSVNSVHYFVQLPYVLNSDAAIKELVGEDEMDGKPYYEVKVTFTEEGGGTDFEDEFLYWVHKENFTIDYFAYRFFTEDGGIRFRKALNPRTIGGIRFVDYENYKTDALSTPLKELDSLFEKGELEFLSDIKIENINVVPLKKQ